MAHGAWRIVSLALCLSLIAAAGLKAHGLALDPLAQDSFLSSPCLQIAAIEMETVLGLPLLQPVQLVRCLWTPHKPVPVEVRDMRMYILTLLSAGLFIAAEPPKEAAKVKAKLWAGISVNEPVFKQGGGKKVSILLALVNDGGDIIDPELDSSQLLVNGKLAKNWDITIGNGPRDDRFKALPAGDYLGFGYAYDLAEYFTTPGIYKVCWKVKGFRTPEVVFRVLPKNRPADNKGAAKAKLWAGISVNAPDFKQGDEKQVVIRLAVVNDGDRVVDPGIDSSRMLVNGKLIKKLVNDR
jgi:hypothetical protein